jgi:peptidoglycan/xylan/chitin deacetylase (PgdA/CDA1 family)
MPICFARFRIIPAMAQPALSRVTETAFDHIAGSLLISAMARSLTDQRLRVLCYHEVNNPATFQQQVSLIAREYRPVSAAEVAAAYAGSGSLPSRALWVTFDDGSPSVIKHAVPIMNRYGINATLFVCPGVIGQQYPFWWQVVERAWALGVGELGPFPGSLQGTVSGLKIVPDSQRRREIERLQERIAASTGLPHQVEQMTLEDLNTFVAAGGDLGNHTWDHPVLDQCSQDEQERQVLLANAWFQDNGLAASPYFAYPNGNPTVFTRRLLHDSGLRLAVLFNHRLANHSGDPYMVSRLRVSADEPLPRFRAILSGLHPMVDSWRRKRRQPEGIAPIQEASE